MGRKAVNKSRKVNPLKRREWIKELYPYFNENGLKELRMDKVAELLGKSKSTVYEYFKSKEEIVAETISYKMEALQGYESILMNTQESFGNRYTQLMEYMIPVLTDISSLLLDDIKTYYPNLWLNVEAFFDHATLVLEKYYTEGIAKKKFRNIHPVILAHSDRFFFNELIDPQFLKKNGINADEAFRSYFDLKFKGLLME